MTLDFGATQGATVNGNFIDLADELEVIVGRITVGRLARADGHRQRGTEQASARSDIARRNQGSVEIKAHLTAGFIANTYDVMPAGTRRWHKCAVSETGCPGSVPHEKAQRTAAGPGIEHKLDRKR